MSRELTSRRAYMYTLIYHIISSFAFCKIDVKEKIAHAWHNNTSVVGGTAGGSTRETTWVGHRLREVGTICAQE